MMDPSQILLVLGAVQIGLIAGFIGGLLGVGGGIIMVPAMILLLGINFHVAKAISLFAIFFLAIFGTINHDRLGNVDRKMGTIIGISGIVGAFIGTYVSSLMDTSVLIIIFAITLFVSAARFFVKVRERKVDNLWAQPALGLGGGFIAGLLGLGGGIILVQGMVYIGVAIHTAVGTSLFAIIFNAASGFGFHVLSGYMGYNDLVVALPLTVASINGVIVGSRYTKKVKATNLKRYFGIVMVIVGIFLILRTLDLIALG